MATKLTNISGLGDNDDGALTAEQQSKLNDFKVILHKFFCIQCFQTFYQKHIFKIFTI